MQFLRHRIERGGERAEFVAAAHVDFMRQLAGGNFLNARQQGLNRHHDVLRENVAENRRAD